MVEVRPQQAPVSLGPFSLEKPIGTGGMCKVWRGLHMPTQTPVAIKVVLEETCRSPEYISAFYDEVRTLAGLSHRGIVRVFDFGRITPEVAAASGGELNEGSPFLVMECASRSLKPYCGHLPWNALKQVLLVLLDALSHAHSRGIIHRDIKPQNILVFESAWDVKLTDFGIAHALEHEGSDGLPEFVEGTPSYMAPEQFTGLWRDYGPWTDLYALGCTAFELACGHPPFHHRKSLRELFIAHVTEEVGSLPEGCDVPPGFDSWLKVLLAKQPHYRFSCAADAARALEALEEFTSADLASILPSKPVVLPPKLLQEEDNRDHTLEALTLFDAGEMRATLQTIVQEVVQSSEEFEQVSDLMIVDEEEEITLTGQNHPSGLWGQGFVELPSRLRWLEEPVPSNESVLLEDVGLSLFPYRTLPLIDRREERSLLWGSLLQTYERREAHMVQVWGASGLGKSRLVQWLCEHAQTRGLAHVLKALHSPNAGSFHGLRAMLARHLRCTGLRRDELFKRLTQKLSPSAVLSENGFQALTEVLLQDQEEESYKGLDRSGLPIRQSIDERHAVIWSYLRFLCQTKPVILWLEDIHWGLDTLHFVSYAMAMQRRMPLPLLFVMVLREDELKAHSFESEQLRALLQYPNATHTQLGPLSHGERARLVRSLGLSDDLAWQVEQRTQGNPMFAVQLVTDMVTQGMLRPTSDGLGLIEPDALSMPVDMKQLWRERIERALRELSPDIGRSFELAACLGQIVDFREWSGVCAQAGITASTEFVELFINQQLVRWDDDTQESWSFVDGYVRDVLYQRAREAGRFEEHHFHCAATLLDGRVSADTRERLGRHYWWAGAHNAALAAFLKAIWEFIELGAYRRAERLFREWEGRVSESDLLSHHSYWGERGLLYARFARAKSDFSQALRYAEDTYLNAKRHNWKSIRLRALLEIGYVGWRAGYAPAQVEVCLQQAEGLALQLNEQRLLGESRCVTGDYFNFHGKPKQAKGFFERAMDAFEPLNDYEGMGRVCLGLAGTFRQTNQLDNARSHVQEALLYFRQTNSRDGIARCLSTLGDLERLEGHLQQAELSYRESMHHYITIGSGEVAQCELKLAFILILQGKFVELAAYLERALESFTQGGRRELEAAACLGFVTLSAYRRDWHSWDSFFQRVDQLVGETAVFDVDHALAAETAGTMTWEAGEWKRAQRVYLIAYEQWLALKRDDDAKRVEGYLQRLRQGTR